MKRIHAAWLVATTAAVAVGCGAAGGDASGAAGMSGSSDYGTTKQMVIDILNSSEGKGAVKELLQDPTMRQAPVSPTEISKAVEKSLSGKEGKQLFEEGAKDPEFAASLTKAMEPQLVTITKQLMKDPEYQKEMLVLLQSPEFSQQMLTVLKTPQYRSAIMKVMTEALSTPSFRMQFQDALKKAVAESMPASGGQQGGQQGGGQSGGQSGGGSEGGSGQGGGSEGGGGS